MSMAVIYMAAAYACITLIIGLPKAERPTIFAE